MLISAYHISCPIRDRWIPFAETLDTAWLEYLSPVYQCDIGIGVATHGGGGRQGSSLEARDQRVPCGLGCNKTINERKTWLQPQFPNEVTLIFHIFLTFNTLTVNNFRKSSQTQKCIGSFYQQAYFMICISLKLFTKAHWPTYFKVDEA